MEPFLESLSLPAREKLRQEDITSLSELAHSSIDDLKTLFSFSAKDILALRNAQYIPPNTCERDRVHPQKRQREDSPESEEDLSPKNADQLLIQELAPDPLRVRELLPSRWPCHTSISIQSIINGTPISKCENPFIREEVEFLTKLIVGLQQVDHAMNLAIWSRLMQCMLKAAFPTIMAETIPIWAASFERLKGTSEAEMGRHLARVVSALSDARAKRASVPFAPPKFRPRGPFSRTAPKRASL